MERGPAGRDAAAGGGAGDRRGGRGADGGGDAEGSHGVLVERGGGAVGKGKQKEVWLE